MPRLTTAIILFLLFPFSAFAQQLNYVHYDTKDGLAGSTVYGVTQDPDGFIWFATEFGISRFDGERFVNFTTDDGLTDNEVLFIYADHIGRVWIAPFNGRCCYYYKGKIFNEEKDSVLRIINQGGLVGTIREWPGIGLYFGYMNQGITYCLRNDNTVRIFHNIDELKKKFNTNKLVVADGLFKPNDKWVGVIGNTIAVFNQAQSTFDSIKPVPLHLRKYNRYVIRSNNPDDLAGIDYYEVDNYTTAHPEVPDSLGAYINTKKGAYPVYWNGRLGIPYLPEQNISKTLRDREGNLWFTTLGEGVYKLHSGSMKTIAEGVEVFSIARNGKNVLAGDNLGILHTLNEAAGSRKTDFRQFEDNGNQRRLYCMKTLPDQSVILGMDCFLLKYKNGQMVYSPIRPIKSIDNVDEAHIVIGTNFFTLKLRSDNLSVVDTLFRERTTKVLYRNGQYFIGTLNGAVIVDAQKRQTALGNKFPLLSSRITDMCWAPDGGLFVATNDKGVVKYDKENITAHYNLANGLSSNICRSLYCDGQNLWVGTNKGINKVNLQNNRVEAQYTMANGLPSNIINALYTENGVVWAGTPAGLAYFNEQDISNNSLCNLVMEKIMVSGKPVNYPDHFRLNWRQNNIAFEYAGISIKVAGDIVYRYRLSGLDGNWKETRQTTLAYPSLPPGNYTFELYAVNKFGKQSNVIAVHFSVAAPFWKTTGFWVAAVLLLGSAAFFLLNRRYKRNLLRRDEKNRVAREITEARQQALQAQMNPHFVFNCLNSIQQFIMLNEKEKANKYLSEFAHLIRKTLENTEKKNVSVAEEIAYLRKYLEMEQLRYGDAFDFNIRTNEALQADFTEMPAMLLQPYIENSLRHGIRHKSGGKGLIELAFIQENNRLTCIVKDNGIGREAAQKLKSTRHIEYQSKGMALTARRIELLNAQGGARIKVEVSDVKDETGNIAGTEVKLEIPLK